MTWLRDALEAEEPPPRPHVASPIPNDAECFRKVDDPTPLSVVRGQCALTGHFYDRDGECLYCPEEDT